MEWKKATAPILSAERNGIVHTELFLEARTENVVNTPMKVRHKFTTTSHLQLDNLSALMESRSRDEQNRLRQNGITTDTAENISTCDGSVAVPVASRKRVSAPKRMANPFRFPCQFLLFAKFILLIIQHRFDPCCGPALRLVDCVCTAQSARAHRRRLCQGPLHRPLVSKVSETQLQFTLTDLYFAAGRSALAGTSWAWRSATPSCSTASSTSRRTTKVCGEFAHDECQP